MSQVRSFRPQPSIHHERWSTESGQGLCCYAKQTDRVKLNECQYLPGGPVVKTSPSNAGGVSSIPDWGVKNPTCLRARKPKHKAEAML